jgi:hypothetical protein
MTEADAQELAWFRDWRKRLLSAMRLWWIGPSYAERCKGWSAVSRICKEKPPTEGSEG